MELHQTLKDLVTTYGTGVLGDAAGLRGMLDDVLDESAASPGEINLLVDAVRFDVLSGLTQMIDGGADPARAVEESGARLARERGGDDATSGSWAAAVLGYAVGRVPEAVVVRYRSQRAPSPFAPPSGQPLQSPVPPPLSPVAPMMSPPQAPLPPPAPAFSPVPPTNRPAGPPPPPVQSPPAAWPTPAASYSPAGPGAPRKSRKALWIGGALALLLVIGGVVGVVVATSGGDSPAKPTDDPSGPADLSAAGIQQRYAGLGSNISAGISDCTALDPATGESEAVSCTTPSGTLQLTTYESLGALKKERHQRLDRQRGSLANNAGTAAYYSYDPEIDSSSDTPALVYWDTETDLQSATLSGDDGVKLSAVEALFRKTDAPVGPPTGVVNSMLDRFLGYWIDDDSACKPSPIYAKGETEELYCKVHFRGSLIGVSFGRFATRAEDVDYRDYYQTQYKAASTRGAGPRWVFTDSRDYLDGGARYTYVERDGGKAYTIGFWDWHYRGCACWATAYTKGSDPALVDAWWTKALAESY